MEIFRNRLISEYSREELEELFLRRVKQLDEKALEIKQLEEKASQLQGKLTRIKQDINDTTKQRVRFDGKMAPTAFRSTVVTAKQLENEIAELDIQLANEERARDDVKRKVDYFRSLLNFPGRQFKTTKFDNRPKKTLQDLLDMLADLSSRNTDPLIVNRLKAATFILQNDLPSAVEPMRIIMKLIGEDNLPVFESIDKQKELKKREEEIEQLNKKLAKLKAQQDSLQQVYNANLDQFKIDSDNNIKKLTEINDLTHQVREKELSLSELNQLNLILDSLMKEIELLKQQRDALKDRNKEDEKKLRESLENQLANANKELQDLQAKIDEYRKSNENSRKTIDSLQQQYQQTIQKRQELEDGFNQLQSEFINLRSYYFNLHSYVEVDPWDSEAFVLFLQQMKDQHIPFSTLMKYINQVNKLYDKNQHYEDGINKYKPILEDQKRRLEEHRKAAQQLRDQLGDYSNAPDNQNIPAQRPFQYTAGAEHITIEAKDVETLEPGFAAIMLTFTAVDLSPSPQIPTGSANLCLTVDFYTCALVTTGTFKNGYFENADILFKVRSDPDLERYLQSSKIPVKLISVNGQQITEIASGYLFMEPLLREKSFTAVALMYDSNKKVIAQIGYECKKFDK